MKIKELRSRPTICHGAGLTLMRPCCIPHPLFEAEDLCVEVCGTEILKSVSLQINEGCVTSIVGPSGSGKSTFLLVISGLLPLVMKAKVRGKLRYRGHSFDQNSDMLQIIRKEVGVIFQEPTPFPVSIYKNLELPLKEAGIRSKAERKDRIEFALRNVCLWQEVEDRLHRSALSLSGGQKQRLCLARALVLEPTTLLLDEPTGALDPLATEIIEDFIKKNEDRLTVVLVTHNLAQAKRLSNYVAIFRSGETSSLVESGEAAELFSRPTEAFTKRYLLSEAV
ncbi:MAG: ATP-binding cassette domain-containing protein [bacterium]|nr:ATP-binding cassette domain-containing protein [bacterium]